MHTMQSRRDFLTTRSAAGGAGLVGLGRPLADEPSLETTTIRLVRTPGICVAPVYLAEELLRAEGFTDFHYVETAGGFPHAQKIARGEIDLSMVFAPTLLIAIDAGQSITVVAGVHPGCFELFAHEPIRTISDLKGKKVGIDVVGSSAYVYVAVMGRHVGLDPVNDIDWITTPSGKPMQLFAEDKIDAFLGFPPEPQELRARGIGQVILNSTVDRPWSQYFCCMLAGNTNFIRQHPIATKHAVRAILKATDLCVAEPERVAQHLVAGGFTQRYDYALQTMTELPYSSWREYDPEDTLRFYALRLHEIGLIKSSPNKIIAEGTDWRFLNELKRELKA
jgi:NitT/TauT family transport system substrate-binding protein